MGSTSIMIRVRPPDLDTWLAVHHANKELRREYGISDGPLYRDANDPDVALVHWNVEDVDRALQWFSSDAFKAALVRAGMPERELWIAEKWG